MQTGQARLKPISALAALTMLAGFAGCQTTKFADPVTNPGWSDGTPIPEKWQNAAAAPDDAKTVIERSALREQALATLTEYTASNNALLRAQRSEALSPAGKRLQAPSRPGWSIRTRACVRSRPCSSDGRRSSPSPRRSARCSPMSRPACGPRRSMH